MKRYVVLGCALVAAGAVAGWVRFSRSSEVKVVSIEVTSIAPHLNSAALEPESANRLAVPGALPATRDPTATTENVGLPAPVLAPALQGDAAPRVPSVLDANQLIVDLARDHRLSADERANLSSVLESAAEMQKRIDRRSDATRRAALQQKLSHQLAVRLNLVLGEERARATSTSLLEKHPRIVLAGSTDT